MIFYDTSLLSKRSGLADFGSVDIVRPIARHEFQEICSGVAFDVVRVIDAPTELGVDPVLVRRRACGP